MHSPSLFTGSEGEMMSLAAMQKTLKGLVRVDLEMEVLTGLLIRMPVHAQVYRIGGADLYPIITKRKYLLSDQRGRMEIEVDVPIVPGSSLKGRMRSLLELALGKSLYSTDGRIWLHARMFSERERYGERYGMQLSEMENDIISRCEIDEVFGAPAIGIDQLLEAYARRLADRSKAQEEVSKLVPTLAITRLLVDDMYPTVEYVRALSENGNRLISIADFLEEKGENRIDRVTSAADPRQVVRVKPGVVFGGALRLLVFDIDKGYVKRNLEIVARGLKFVEETYLGASGSRGYGRIKFRDLSVAVAKASDPALSYQEIGKFDDVEGLLAKVEDVASKIEQVLFQ